MIIIKRNPMIFLMLISISGMVSFANAQEPNSTLDWSIKTDKQTFYPGEPVLLNISIKNRGNHEERIDFGWDGVGAFSFEIQDSKNIIISEGHKIQGRGGISRVGACKVSPNKMGEKSVVLNRWCSTLLQPGLYHIICNIDYRLFSEDQKQPNNIAVKAGPIHKVKLRITIRIIDMDRLTFERELESLAECEQRPESQITKEWLQKRDVAREMLAFTQSELAIPYQLKILRDNSPNWFKADMINTLVNTGTVEAARGLVEIANEQSRSKEGVQPSIVEGIYKLREKGNPDVMRVTQDFVKNYKRPPVPPKPVD
jgi:hypothetical protein